MRASFFKKFKFQTIRELTAFQMNVSNTHKATKLDHLSWEIAQSTKLQSKALQINVKL
jgi:hypothetical protein